MIAKEKFIRLVLREEDSLLNAMRALEDTGIGIALIANSEGQLLGTLTDGDIRRALLSGAMLNDKVWVHMCSDCLTVKVDAGRAEVIDLMQARWFNQIPVVDDTGKLLGLHTLHGIIGCVERPNWAVIMAGGKGTRLRPITENIPKPMVPVAGRPILERIVLHLVSYGIRRIFLSVNYLAHIIEDHFGDGSRFGCQIEYLREDKPLGTGGPLSLLPEKPQDPVLVMNGDLVMQTDFADMLRFHDTGGNYATMGLRPYVHEVPYGCAEIVGDRITGLVEKPILEKFINAGVYVLSPEAVTSVPADTMFPITTLFDRALAGDNPCGAYHMQGEWIDVGQPELLREARGD